MPWNKNDATMQCYLVFVFSIALIGTESYNDEGVEKVTFDAWWRKWSVVRLHKNNANDVVANVTLPLQLKIKISGTFSWSYLTLNLKSEKSYHKENNNDVGTDVGTIETLGILPFVGHWVREGALSKRGTWFLFPSNGWRRSEALSGRGQCQGHPCNGRNPSTSPCRQW